MMKWWFAAFLIIWLGGGVMRAIDMPYTAIFLTNIGLFGFIFMWGVFLGRELEKPNVSGAGVKSSDEGGG